ncbi:MAG: type II toxin-antitoxin system VapC family toxin [Planctomycetia bacterium]|nr:type II toxin-antitoxin system VapC family toxin [Planctomycetia bacterium]
MIFIDTGAFLARYLHRDQYHDKATSHWQVLSSDRRPCFTSNFVVDETITLLARRSTYEFAAVRARNIYESVSLSILRPDENDELAAVELFQKYADQEVSFTDCVSFILMEKHDIRCAFSFDRHFTIAGFEVEPV